MLRVTGEPQEDRRHDLGVQGDEHPVVEPPRNGRLRQRVPLPVRLRVGRQSREERSDVDVRTVHHAVAELGEDTIEGYVTLQHHHQPPLYEGVDARDEPAPLGHLLAPVVAVQLTPVGDVQRIDVSPWAAATWNIRFLMRSAASNGEPRW